MLELILIRGLPGSGKSTLAQELIEHSPVDLFYAEADHFFEEVNDDLNGVVYKFDRRFLGAAHDWCYGHVMHSLKRGVSTVVANTFSTEREIMRYVEGVKRAGIKATIRVVKCLGEYESVHRVPKSAIQRMKERWEDFPGEVEYPL